MLAEYFALKGESCIAYNDGAEGLKALREDSFDIVLLDLAMPNFSGFDTLKALAYQGVLDKTNVIIITAMDISSKREKQMIDAGVVKVIRKPFSLSTLDKVLKEHRQEK
jgi:DNA-binding response OmpR family regulator